MKQFSEILSTLLLTIRAILRIFRIVLHLIWGMILILSIYPLVSRTTRLLMKKHWSKKALQMLGIQLNIQGQPMAYMRVANHISWLDIVVINAVIPSAFIAKDDVRSWPLLGWLSTHTESYFIKRGSRQAAHKAAWHIANLLQANIDVMCFPEGTTSSKGHVLPFYSALLQGAIIAKVPIQPIAIRYHDHKGQFSRIPEYCDDTSLGTSIWRVACANNLCVTLYLLPEVASTTYDRKALTAVLRERIMLCLQDLVL